MYVLRSYVHAHVRMLPRADVHAYLPISSNTCSYLSMRTETNRHVQSRERNFQSLMKDSQVQSRCSSRHIQTMVRSARVVKNTVAKNWAKRSASKSLLNEMMSQIPDYSHRARASPKYSSLAFMYCRLTD